MDNQNPTTLPPNPNQAVEPTVWEYLRQVFRIQLQRLLSRAKNQSLPPDAAASFEWPPERLEVVGNSPVNQVDVPAAQIDQNNDAVKRVEPKVSVQVLPAPEKSNEGEEGCAQVQLSVVLPPGVRLNITMEAQQSDGSIHVNSTTQSIHLHAEQKPGDPSQMAMLGSAISAKGSVLLSKLHPHILHYQQTISRPVFFGSLLASLLGLWLLLQSSPFTPFWLNLLLFCNGIFVFILAKPIDDDGKQTIWEYGKALVVEIPSGIGGTRWQRIFLGLAPLFAVGAVIAAGQQEQMRQPFLAVVSWLVAIILVMIGGWQLTARWRWHERVTTVLAIGITLLAFGVRGWNLAYIPSVLTGDEASMGLSSVRFVTGETNNIFITEWFSFPAFYYFLQSLSIRFLGQTTQALRFLSAVAGALTVGAVFVVGRIFFNRWIGLLAALFLLAFHYHNHFSRIGLNNIWDGLWYVIVFGMLWYGWEKQNRNAFLLCGLFLGIAQYFYVTSRILLLLVPLYMVVMIILDVKSLRVRLPDVALMWLVCLVVLLPLAMYFMLHPQEFNAPFQRATIFGQWMENEVAQTDQSPILITLKQIGLGVSGLYKTPLRAWYEPQTALLRPFSVVLFFLGLLFLLPKWRDGRTLILWMWLGIATMAVGLSENPPSAQRFVIAAPVVAVIIGFGLAEIGRVIQQNWPRYTRWINWLLLAVLLWVCVDELNFYYRVYTPQAYLGGENGYVAQKLADYVKTKDADWQVVFFGWPRMGYYSFSTLPYLAPQIEGVDFNHPWGSPENPPIPDGRLLFVFLPEYAADLEAVQFSYPGGRLVEEFNTQDETLYWLYEVDKVP